MAWRLFFVLFTLAQPVLATNDAALVDEQVLEKCALCLDKKEVVYHCRENPICDQCIAEHLLDSFKKTKSWVCPGINEKNKKCNDLVSADVIRAILRRVAVDLGPEWKWDGERSELLEAAEEESARLLTGAKTCPGCKILVEMPKDLTAAVFFCPNVECDFSSDKSHGVCRSCIKPAHFRCDCKQYERIRSSLSEEEPEEEPSSDSLITKVQTFAYKLRHVKCCPNCREDVVRIEGCNTMVCGVDRAKKDVPSKNGCGVSFFWTPVKGDFFPPALPYWRKALVLTLRAMQGKREPWYDAPSFVQRLQAREIRFSNTDTVVFQDGKCATCKMAILTAKVSCLNCPNLDQCLYCVKNGAKLCGIKHTDSHLSIIVLHPSCRMVLSDEVAITSRKILWANRFALASLAGLTAIHYRASIAYAAFATPQFVFKCACAAPGVAFDIAYATPGVIDYVVRSAVTSVGSFGFWLFTSGIPNGVQCGYEMVNDMGEKTASVVDSTYPYSLAMIAATIMRQTYWALHAR